MPPHPLEPSAVAPAERPAAASSGQQIPDFQTLFESAPDLYLVLTPDFRIVAVSDAYLSATKTTRESIVGRGIFEVFPDDPNDPAATGVSNLRDSLKRARDLKRPDTMAVQKYSIQRAESEGGGFEERYWSPVNSPIFDRDTAGGERKVRYILHRVADVTEFVRLKQSVQADRDRARTEEMEAEVYRRAQAVQEINKELRGAKEELEQLYEESKELDQIKTQFFSNVSHELRTPLAIILGLLHKRLAASDMTANMQRDLKSVERNARLLLKHVNDLLDLSKLEAGRMTMDYAETDLARLVRFVGSCFETRAEDLEIRYSVSAPQALPAQIDSEKLERVLLNLLSNACKFTPAGGSVEMTLTSQEGRAIVRVQDSGPGVPPPLREAIFERFRQGESGSNRKHGGTGLGLAIVKEFVGLHGGDVHVEAAPSGGALFVVDIPTVAPPGSEVRREEDASAEAQTSLANSDIWAPARLESASSAEPIDADAPLVLVVEDNPDMNAFLAGTLAGKYRVVTAFDGEEGREKALTLHPDLILSDIMMPRMSGDRMVQELRKLPQLADTPVILLTARGDEDLRVHFMEEQVQDYLQKPFAPEELQVRVARLIAEHQRKERTRLLLAAIVESSSDSIVGKTLDGIITSWNPGAERLYGYASQEMIGQSVRTITPPDRMEELEDILRRLRRGERIPPFETQRVRKSGEVIDVSVTVSPILNPSGEAIGASSIARDITESKRIQEERGRLLARVQQADLWQRTFLREVLFNVTEGRLRLCEDRSELPRPLEMCGEPSVLRNELLRAFRQKVTAFATELEFPAERLQDFMTGVGEITMNAVVHGGGGEAYICGTPGKMLQVWVEDQGGGMALGTLHRATLEKGYTTASSMGYGWFLTLQGVDRVWLMTGPSGTTVVLEQEATPPEPFLASFFQM